MRINSSGFVGIGTTDPGSAKLNVQSTSSSTDIWVGESNTRNLVMAWKDFPTDYAVVETYGGSGNLALQTSGGNVGIGTTTPSEKLSVRGDSIAIRHITSNNVMGSIGQRGSGVDAGYIQLNNAGAATVAIDTNGTSYFNGGNVGIGTTTPEAKLNVWQTGTSALLGSFETNSNNLAYTQWKNTQNTGYLGIDTSTGGGLATGSLTGSFGMYSTGAKALHLGTNGSVRLTVDSSGNVAVGTTTATSRLHVANTSSNSILTIDAPAANAAQLTFMKTGGDSKGGIYSPASSNDLRFFDDGGTDTLTLENGGNVGIGTTNPSYKLDVTGSMNINGDGNYLRWGAGDAQIDETGYKLGFSTYTGSALTEKLSILGNGNVGIGTTTPNNMLDIYSTTKSAIGFSGASGSTNKWTMGMDVINGGRFSIASSTALGSLDRFVIDGNGNIGIGTTTPLSRLAVSGGTSIGANYNAAAPTNGLIVEGNVGIGTTNPTSKVSIYGTQQDAALNIVQVTGVNSSGSAKSMIFQITAGTPEAMITTGAQGTDPRLSFSTGGAAAQMTLTTSGNFGIGTTTADRPLTFARAVGEKISLFSNSAAARDYYGFGIEAGVLANQVPDGQSVYFYDGSTANMVINGSGNVGIGTTTASAKLTVSGEEIRLIGSGTSGDASLGYLQFYDSNSSTVRGYVGDGSTGNSDIYLYSSTGNLRLGANTAPSAIYVQGSNGNVGIGTTNPGSKLHVVGGALTLANNADGAIRYSGNNGYYSFITQNTPNVWKIERLGTDGNASDDSVSLTLMTVSYTGDVGVAGCLTYNSGTLGTCLSDERLKTNINTLEFSDALNKIAAFDAKTFEYLADPDREYSGLIAQQVEVIAPEMVVTRDDGFKMIKYGDIQWLMVSAFKEVLASITEIKNTMLAYAERFVSREIVATEKICIGSTCMNESQLATLLQNAGLTASAATTPTTNNTQPTTGDSSTASSTSSTTSSTPTTATTTTQSTATSTASTNEVSEPVTETPAEAPAEAPASTVTATTPETTTSASETSTTGESASSESTPVETTSPETSSASEPTPGA